LIDPWTPSVVLVEIPLFIRSSEGVVAVRRWARSSQGFVTIGGALMLIAGIVGVVTATPARTTVQRLLDGSAFVSDTKNGALVHANGSSGAADLKVALGENASSIDIVQRDGAAYASVVRPDGSKVLYRVGDISDGKADNHRRDLTGDQRIVRGGENAYLVDEPKGTVLAIDATTLEASKSEPIRFERGISVVAGDDGSLLVAEPRSGKMFIVTGTSRDSGTDVGDRGDDLAMTLVAGKPVLVNGTSGTAYVVEDGEIDVRVSLPPGGTFRVPESTERNQIVILQPARSRLVVVDLESGEARQIPVPAAAAESADPLATSWALFLADRGSGSVVEVDSRSGELKPVEGTPLGAGDNFQVFVKDDHLWLNTPGESKATVVGPDRRAHEIDKFEDSIPVIDATEPETITDPPVPPEPVPTPTPTPGPDPIPTPTPGPTPGPIDGGGGGDGGGGATTTTSTTQPPPVATAPGAPGDFRGQPGDAQVTLSWTAAAANGSDLTRYLITCTPDCGPGGTSGTTIEVDPTATTRVVSGLKNGKRASYSFTIVAVNAVGPGPQAAAGPFSPSPDAPGRPTNVQATANDDGTVTLTWDRPDDSNIDPAAYTITAVSSSTSPSWTGVTSKVFPVTDATVVAADRPTYTTPADQLGYDDDDQPDFSFTVQAASATNVSGPASDPSAPVDPYNTPAPIDPARATAAAVAGDRAGNAAIDLAWAPVGARGRAVRYVVERVAEAVEPANPSTADPPVDTGAAAVDQPSGGTASTRVTGLTNGTAYRVRVTPVNAAGAASGSWTTVTRPTRTPTLSASGPRQGNGSFSVDFTVNWYGHSPGRCANNGTTISCSNPLVVSGLGNGGSAGYSILAVNLSGQASNTAAGTGSSIYTPPPKPMATCPTRLPANCSVSQTTNWRAGTIGTFPRGTSREVAECTVTIGIDNGVGIKFTDGYYGVKSDYDITGC